MSSIQSTPLNAVTATGLGNPTLYISPRNIHSMQVHLTGAPTAAVVRLIGGLDPTDTTKAFTLATWTYDAVNQPNDSLVVASETPVNWINAILDTLTAGTAPTVTASVTSESY